MQPKLYLTDFEDGRMIEEYTEKSLEHARFMKNHNGGEYFVVENAKISYMGGEKSTFSAVCNHIGCSIFALLGMVSAKTLLCARKVYTTGPDIVCLRENLKILDLKFPYRDDLTATLLMNDLDILNSIFAELDDNCGSSVSAAIKKDFGQMLVVDAYLGNRIRNIDRWGLSLSGELCSVCVTDCSGSLFPETDYVQMAKILTDYETGNPAFTDFIMEGCKSPFYRNGCQLTYQELLGSKEKFMIEAIQNVVSRIDDDKVENLIDGELLINPLHKRFLKTVLRERKRQILLPALQGIWSN